MLPETQTMRLATCLSAASLACALTLPAQAQDYSLEPTYGTVTLEPGFPEDPIAVELHSGGSVDASTLGGACVGFISTHPDYRVNYIAGTNPLYFVVVSDADTTLVVNGPDGTWSCDDDSDSADDFDPLVAYPAPASGQYDVWVGTYKNDSLHEATLYVTEDTDDK